MCGGSGPVDDFLNITKDLIEGGEEMITHNKEKRAAERKVEAQQERAAKIREERKIEEDTQTARRKETSKRTALRQKQKSKQADTGRKGTILTDGLDTTGTSAAADVTGTLESGKTLLGV